MSEIRYADVVEGVRAAMAAYAHALDDGRAEDVVATFCEEGSIDIPGMGTHEGHQALLAAYRSWAPKQPQRHLVVNTHVDDWDDDWAMSVSDLVFLLKGDAGWTVQIVGRYRDHLHRHGDAWHFHRRVAEFV